MQHIRIQYKFNRRHHLRWIHHDLRIFSRALRKRLLRKPRLHLVAVVRTTLRVRNRALTFISVYTPEYIYTLYIYIFFYMEGRYYYYGRKILLQITEEDVVLAETYGLT